MHLTNQVRNIVVPNLSQLTPGEGQRGKEGGKKDILTGETACGNSFIFYRNRIFSIVRLSGQRFHCEFRVGLTGPKG